MNFKRILLGVLYIGGATVVLGFLSVRFEFAHKTLNALARNSGALMGGCVGLQMALSRLSQHREKMRSRTMPAQGSKAPVGTRTTSAISRDRQAGGVSVMTVGELLERPAPPRHGKSKSTPMDAREKALDRIMTCCLEYVGVAPWNTGPIYIVNTDRYVPAQEREDGSQIVITDGGIEVHQHNVDRRGDHQVSRYRNLQDFLRGYVSVWLPMLSQREVAKRMGREAMLKAVAEGRTREFFDAVKEQRRAFESPLEKRLDEFLSGAAVASASAVIDGHPVAHAAPGAGE